MGRPRREGDGHQRRGGGKKGGGKLAPPPRDGGGTRSRRVERELMSCTLPRMGPARESGTG